MKDFNFKTCGPEKNFVDPAGIHVLIPYRLKSPVCPFGRFNDECRSGCGLCDVETTVTWANKNNYHHCMTRGKVFYEQCAPKYMYYMENQNMDDNMFAGPVLVPYLMEHGESTELNPFFHVNGCLIYVKFSFVVHLAMGNTIWYSFWRWCT